MAWMQRRKTKADAAGQLIASALAQLQAAQAEADKAQGRIDKERSRADEAEEAADRAEEAVLELRRQIRSIRLAAIDAGLDIDRSQPTPKDSAT